MVVAQSFDLTSVHALEIDGARTEFNPQRSLTDAEKQLREINALWADVPGQEQIGNYGTQDWRELPLMVWWRPGESGTRFVGANWVDQTGRPCFEPPVATDFVGPNVSYGEHNLAEPEKLYYDLER